MQLTRIIYLDIDGTLRDEVQGVTLRTAQALEQCRAKGIYIVLCTGRNPASIQPDVRCLPVNGLIAGGGCYVWLGGRELYRNFFPEQTVAAAWTTASQLGLGLSMEAEYQIFMNKDAAQFYREDFERKLVGCTDPFLARHRNQICYEDNLDTLEFTQTPVHKICLMGKGVSLAARELSNLCRIVQRSTSYLELLPPGCGKGSAIRLVNRTLGIARADSLCFGDGENDLDMFDATGVRVAVRGGCPALVRQADSICGLPSESGIADELERQGILSSIPNI